MPSANRRDFLKTTAAVGAAVSLTAASYERVYGANEQMRVAFLGTGGRSQDHITAVLKMVQDKKPVRPMAVCDVWNGEAKLGFDRRTNTYQGRGLYPSAKRCGID